MRRKAHSLEGYLSHARLTARARARCPRPQGRRRCKGRARSLRRRKAVHRRLPADAASHGPSGRAHLALAMRRKAHWLDGLPRPCAPGGACEGKMPSPPRGRRRCKGMPGACAVGKRYTGRLPAAAARHGHWGRGHLAHAMRRKAHWFDGLRRPCAPGGACEGRMPSPPGSVATARACREPAPQKGGAPGVYQRMRPAMGPGGEGILPSLCAARRIGSMGCLGHARLAGRARAGCPRPQGAVAAARACREPAPQKGGTPGGCERVRPAAGPGPGGEGILPSLCAARRIGSMGYVGHVRLAARGRGGCPRP